MGRGPDDVTGLLARARAGSMGDLGRLLEGYRRYLLLIAERELDPELRAKGGASDLVQETFLDAQRDFACFAGDSEAELLAWLRQLLLHNVGHFTRRYKATQKRQVRREVSFDGAPSSADLRESLAAETPPPDEQVAAAERAERVRRVLSGLPEEYRRVLVWRYEDDLPFEQIAERLGKTANACRKLWARAVERFEQAMGDLA